MSEAVRISRAELARLIHDCDDQFFTVTFIKRTTGETRVMNCRQGVRKYLAGGTLGYDPIEKGLVPVWDRNVEDPAKAYRMINVDGLLGATIAGQQYIVA